MDNVIKGLLALLLTFTTGMASWSLYTTQQMEKTLGVLQYQVNELSKQTAAIAKNDKEDVKQNVVIKIHWKLLGYHRDQINALRHEGGQPPISWPDTD